MFDVAEAVGRWFLWGITTAINAVIAALGAVVGFVWEALPGLPDPLTPPSDGVAEAIAWVFPVGAIVAVMAAALSAYVSFLLCRVALRWVKAL